MDWHRFRASKTYDVLAALPLALWYASALWQQLPLLRTGFWMLGADAGRALQFLSVAGAAAFYLAVVVGLMARRTPVARAQGWLPRAVAVAGTFLSVGIIRLPAAAPPLVVQAVANALIFAGCAAGAAIVWWLGRSFSILPEARELVTRGPYAVVRHPLYAAEALIIAGTAVQFVQPWAGVLGVVNLVLLIARSVYEERVLARAYPDYAAYRARTARFMPGVF